MGCRKLTGSRGAWLPTVVAQAICICIWMIVGGSCKTYSRRGRQRWQCQGVLARATQKMTATAQYVRHGRWLEVVWFVGCMFPLETSQLHAHICACAHLCIVSWRHNGKTFVIQIKICAEYRDMLPRPRLVCQEPGLRPIGRSPGVPDKSSRGLGSMSRYSAQILICFIAYIFSIFNFSVGLIGNLAELPPCTVPPATVHCYQNEAAQCSSDNQISQHALLRGSRKKHSLAFIYATELVKLADKMDEICISGKFSVQESSKWRFLLHTCE